MRGAPRCETSSDQRHNREAGFVRWLYPPICDLIVAEEANMSELRYPNESREYRDARDALLRDEQELVD